jgi:hypothetical protein
MTQTKWHKLTLSAVTPTFLGRYDSTDPRQHNGQIPFPVPSLRGALAYWLRALAGAHVGNDLDRLARAEGAVFGSARARDTGGPSTIWLRGRQPVGISNYVPAGNNAFDIGYLMGPGLRHDPKVPAPRYVKPGTPLPLEVRNTGGAEHADLFLCALWGLRTFGGIGARARRGFGAISVLDKPVKLPAGRFNQDWLIRDSADDLTGVLDCIGQCLDLLGIPRGAADNSRPSYPRFDLAGAWYSLDPGTEILEARNVEDALAETGLLLRAFRLDGEENTAGWREIVRPFLDEEPFHAPFHAGALGLPVVYTQLATEPGEKGRSATIEPVVNGQPSRRASPLWLRVHQAGRIWSLRSLAFHATWLPDDGKTLRIRNNQRDARQPDKPVTAPDPDAVEQEVKRWFSFLPEYLAAQAPA